MTNRERRFTFRSLICLAAGTIGLAVVTIALTIWALRVDAKEDAAHVTGNLATILAEQTARAVKSVDLATSELQERIAGLGVADPDSFRRLAGTKDVQDLLIDRLARLPPADVIVLADDSGRIWNNTRALPRTNVSLADRDFFQRARQQRTRDLAISLPAGDRLGSASSIYFTKRMEGPKGQFVGVIVVASKLDYFSHVYDSLYSLHDQSFVLLRTDGAVLVRHPESAAMLGKTFPPDSQWHSVVQAGGGHFRSDGYFDGKARLVSVQPVRDYPLVVNVAVTEATAFANWTRRSIFLGAGTLLTVVCSLLLLRALVIQFRRLVDSRTTLAEREVRLAEKSQELERANMQFDAALNNITQGLCMFDEHTRVVVINQRYIDMYGLSREVVKPGCTLRTLIENRKAVGLFKGDPEQYCLEIINTIRQGKTATQLIETTDGRTIYAVNQPMQNGGWVVTHDDITERKRVEEQMAHMARHDALTGLANRVLLLERMEEALARLRRQGEGFSVFVFDLDLFKAVNDSLGHPIGDALLRAVGDRLRQCTGDTDTVARLGGDEFALLQSIEGDQRENAILLANRLLEAVNAPYNIDGHEIAIGTSIGIVLAPADGVQADQLLKNADLALYRAKSEGRNGFRLFEHEMDAEARSRHALQIDLRTAIARGEFELHYQPVLDALTRAPVGAEALVRWRHPLRGVVQPGQFIQLAEEIGMIGPLGEWILRKACADAVHWPEHIRLAVNLSPAQFRNCNLVEVVAGALVESGLCPQRLELEITESVLLQKNARNLATLHQLKSLGISIVLDDFGTGYSSLSYLRMFPFDKIKIDKSFVGELSNRADCAAIVCAVSGLGRGLNIITTAEGVETEEQFALLRAAGVDQVQGFLFGMPRPLAELEFLRPANQPASGRAA